MTGWSFDRIEAWARALAASGLEGMEVEEEGFRLVLRKEKEALPSPAPAPVRTAAGRSDPPAPAGAPAPLAASSEGAAPSAAAPTTVITSPKVGVFHRLSPKGEDRPFHAGDGVRPGDVLGEVMVLSVPYEVVSPVAGSVREILVEDGLGVEFGQPLLVIE